MIFGAQQTRPANARTDPRALLVAAEKRLRLAAFENSRLRLVQKNLLLSIYAVPLLAILAGSLFLAWVPLSAAALWAGSFIVVCTASMILIRRFNTDATDPRIVARKLTACGILSALGVTPWAALPFLFGAAGGDASRYICILLEAAAIPYVIATSSATSRAYLLHSAPLVAALVFGPLFNGGPLSYPLAALAAVYSLVMYGIAFQLHGLLTTMFEAKESNLHLLEQVAHAKAESDAARMRAERSNQAKSTFLANMSHELRTPLNAILGFSEVIKTELLGTVGTPLYKEYAADIHASGKHLLGLINDILDLSRIEAGRLDLVPSTLSIHDLADDVCRLIAHHAGKAGVSIVKAIPPDLPLLHADERALRQVLLNLLSNATKFTPPGGRITIEATMGSSVFGAAGMTLCITDTGVGIKKEDLAMVLQAFGQAHIDDLAMTTPRDQGTGLGLPIVRGLLEAHGAEFELQSEFGKGTSAIAHLPPVCVIEPAPLLATAAV